ncbi:hypothetical protein CGLO_14332 [Colletotrichum gloeosporioides Cg-14]|uniref:Uncharacterized protein n=1 Tax=Colletotrichum gloeosporioides (strain Cg-14) TaxID=1237896 RepID=T0K1M3_COLGC|nr:hypothetical protein CGLO_14332 [Colletotrichum gloeosporioides Cg-14]
MVSLKDIEASNKGIEALGPDLVAVFVGATNGVGETTLKRFAKHALRPRVYVVGRSHEAADRILTECRASSNGGTFTFIKGDTSRMSNIDEICNQITHSEEATNILCLTIGTLQIGFEDGLHYPMALTVYARHRFVSKLLPSMRRADRLRRVVSVFGATFEGAIDMSDFQGSSKGWPKLQAHMASIITLSLEAFQKTAPEVSFVHNFPGAVESGITRGSIGPLMRTLKTIFGVLGSLVHIPLEEAGERHLFLCTSARFSSGVEDAAPGVPLPDGQTLARGVTGELGTGVYSIDANGECATVKVERLLAMFREQGTAEQTFDRVENDISKILSSGARE